MRTKHPWLWPRHHGGENITDTPLQQMRPCGFEHLSPDLAGVVLLQRAMACNFWWWVRRAARRLTCQRRLQQALRDRFGESGGLARLNERRR